MLLIRANRFASRDQLIDDIWGAQAPESAASALQGYVAGLRKVIGTERIETSVSRYRLHASPAEIDLGRFEQLASESWSVAPDDAVRRCDEALALWRDAPFAGLEASPFIEAERRRLEELHLATLEQRADAMLALGRHAVLVPELTALVDANPLRERMRSQLMLALYRCGRQSDALDVYREARHRLAAELGLEPGTPLRQLEGAILRRDPELELASPPQLPRPPEAADDAPPRRRSGRRLIVSATAALALVAAAAIAVFATRGGAAAIVPAPNSIAVIDARSNRIVDDIPTGRRPTAITFGAGSIWVASSADGTIDRIDPVSRRAVAQIGVGTEITSLVYGAGSLWAANGSDGTITRIDPSSNGIRDTLFAGSDPLAPRPIFSVAVGAGSLWAVRANELLQIDPATDAVVATRTIPPSVGLAVDRSSIWLTTSDERLVRLSIARPYSTTELELPGQGSAPVLGSGSVWLLVYAFHAAIWQVDPRSATMAGTTGGAVMGPPATRPAQIVVGADGVWSVDERGEVIRFGLESLDVAARVQTGRAGSSITTGAGATWVAVD